MSYYAQFVPHGGAIFRMDTRIYLSGSPASQDDGKRVAAIIGKNPGAALTGANGGWGELKLAGDNMLPSVRNRFIEAYQLAGKQIPKLAFVQVWNLFYLCNKDLVSAVNSIDQITSAPRCRREEDGHTPPIVWFAWGGDNPHLNKYKERFLKTDTRLGHVFFYDYNQKMIRTQFPEAVSHVKHPQGLPRQPVVKHLATIL